MAVKFVPLESPNLDPRNEEQLVALAVDRVYTASGNRLNDISTSSPARALIEGQAFAGAELLYYVNQLPEAMAIEFLKIAGIYRRLGVSSVVQLTFTLTASLATNFTVPAGYVAKTSGGLTFATDTSLIIPSGQVSGAVNATCTTAGLATNTGAFTINSLTQPLAFLQSVTNLTAATGGLDAETVADVKSRAFASIRRRGLVTADDYEQEAKSLLGSSSVAYCLGNLSADKINYELGTVHLFCLNDDGSVLGSGQLISLQRALQKRSHVSAIVYVSNVDVVDVDVSVIASMQAGLSASDVSYDIFVTLGNYLKPGNLPLGKSIVLKELEHLARGVTGIQYIRSVSLAQTLTPLIGSDFPLPYSYSAANLKLLTVTLSDGTNSFVNAYALTRAGDPD
jgi:hypothetical protein